MYFKCSMVQCLSHIKIRILLLKRLKWPGNTSLPWSHWPELCGSGFCLARAHGLQLNTSTVTRRLWTRARVLGLGPLWSASGTLPTGPGVCGATGMCQHPCRPCFRVPGAEELTIQKGLSPFLLCLHLCLSSHSKSENFPSFKWQSRLLLIAFLLL